MGFQWVTDSIAITSIPYSYISFELMTVPLLTKAALNQLRSFVYTSPNPNKDTPSPLPKAQHHGPLSSPFNSQ